MPGVEWIDPVMDVVTPEPFGSTHPMRQVSDEIAVDAAWSTARRQRVTEVFDGLSPGWHADHTADLRLAALEDALDRGDVGTGTLVEIGSGTGAGTERIASRLPVSAAIDLSPGMLSQADRSNAPHVRADASHLPLADRSVAILVLVNMFLFAAEIARVLGSDGRLVWVNTMGEETPIHLPPETVTELLPGRWTAVASRAGTGLWCVARRA